MWVCSSTSADISPNHDGASSIAVMFRHIGILKSLPTSSPQSSTSTCKVKTVPLLIGEEYRIPIVISPVDVISCPFQTHLFVKSGQGNANAFSSRPNTTRLKTVMNFLRGNFNYNSIHHLILKSSRIHEGMTSGLHHNKSVLYWRGCSLSTISMALGSCSRRLEAIPCSGCHTLAHTKDDDNPCCEDPHSSMPMTLDSSVVN